MTAAAPWSVKGIDPRAREAAKDFARRANMTLGEWLNRVILEDETDPAPAAVAVEPQSPAPRSAAGEPYRQSGERMLAPEHPADEVGKVAMALDRLSARIEASEKRTADMAGRSGSGERELNAVAARFEGAVQELSGEHAKLSERLRRIEAEAVGPRSAAALRSLEGALGKVAERLYEGEGRLDGRFAAIEERLVQAEGGAPAEVLRDLSASLLALDSRLRGLEDGGAAAIDVRMSRIEERLTKGFEAARVQTVSQVAAIDQRSAKAIERMGAQVAGVTQSLGARLETVEQRSLQAVERVGGEISRLAGAMEQKLGRADTVQAQALEKLGVEIARITERLAERIATAERRSALAIDDVGEQMARVTDRLTQRHDRASEDIGERIRASEERTARLLEEARERIDTSLQRTRGSGAVPAAAPGTTILSPGATILAPPAPQPPAAAPDWALASPFTSLDDFEPASVESGDAEFTTLAGGAQAQADPFTEPYEAGSFPAASGAPAFSADDFDAVDR
ncbi:MAG: Localization factor PodJS, partial [Caulobacteraceae bacterium]|nr:Localization factor PodJS [Caulobacteraceae bacterium]